MTSVDFNDHVRVGQVLATINTDRLTAQAQQARASLESANAEVLTAEATLEDAERAASRARELFARQLVARSERDAAETALKKAEAALASARARVAQAEASLNAITTDLRKATIRSPIDGIVLDRQVDPGQTVAASFQTPVLFTLARDLSRMTLNVNVDEADIGRVRAGQEAAFTVDAYPTRPFTSHVVDVRSTPKTVSGVRDLRNRSHRGQLRVASASRDDGDCGDYRDTADRRAARAECGTPIHAAGGVATNGHR